MTDLTAVVVIALTAIITLVVARWLRRVRGSWRAKARAARSMAGEDRAADLLESAGFRIIARQARIAWTPLVDGVPLALELRADYLVELGGERFVAEVKTGTEAPSLTTAATRRQLLEYSIAFATDGVLLVCPERSEVKRVEFPR